MAGIRHYLQPLNPADITAVVMLLIMSAILAIFNTAISFFYIFLPINVLLIYIILKLAYLHENSLNPSKLIMTLRYWYGVPLILLIFKEIYYIIFSLKPIDIDNFLIKIDYSVFGAHPTQWIYRFENPLITEFLQIVYVFYYPMIVIFGLQLYLKGRFEEFKYTMFVLFFSFFLSYLLYIIFPAIGPRFHLHNFHSISEELPGLFLTEPIRDFINFGESIPDDVPDPEFYVQRDAMPSLHVISAFLILYLAERFKMKSFYFYLPYFIFMLIATVYLRYHYVVDLIGGMLVCGFTILITNKIYGKTQS
jgi:membrane-associated phospholipid phosphatase